MCGECSGLWRGCWGWPYLHKDGGLEGWSLSLCTDLGSGMLHKNPRVEYNVCLWLHFMITAVDFHVEEL